MTSTRRQFLQTVSAAATATSCAALAAPVLAEEKDQLPIIDCHQHLWDLKKFKLPWLTEGPPLGKSFVMDDYLQATQGLNIVKSIYMEVDVAPEQQQAEADHLIEICQSGKFPTIAAVISGRPAADNFSKYIRPFKGSPYIKGLRQVLHAESAQPGLCITKEFVAGIQLLGELGLSFDLCMRPKELVDGAKLADLCPHTRFILDHCGNGDVKAFLPEKRRAGKPADHDAEQWKKDLALVASKQNVICKISGIIARAPKDWSADDLAPIVNHCLDSFGPGRVIFGSDWPVCLLGASLREWVAALRQIIASRPPEEQKKLLHDNAMKFYGLGK